jgi:ABC-type multidrug transport system fused ATPase/permease subunit
VAIDGLIVARGMTVIVVAHRLSTIRTADSICLVRRDKPK